MIIGKKAKKALYGDLLMILLFVAVIIVSLFRYFGNYSTTIKVVFMGITILGFYYLIKEIIILVNYLILPKDLIIDNGETLKIYSKKNYVEIKKADILSIDKGAFYSKKFLFYNGTIVFKLENEVFPVNMVDNVEDVINTLSNEATSS